MCVTPCTCLANSCQNILRQLCHDQVRVISLRHHDTQVRKTDVSLHAGLGRLGTNGLDLQKDETLLSK